MISQQDFRTFKSGRIDNWIQAGILLVMIVASWVTLNSRVTALEVQQRNDKESLQRVEHKIDVLNTKFDNYIMNNREK